MNGAPVGTDHSNPKWTFLQSWGPFHVSPQPQSPKKAVADCLAVSVPFSLLLDEEKRLSGLETKTQLATGKKKPLRKSRPESAISSHMFLSVHRLTLQVRVREPQARCLHANPSSSTCKAGAVFCFLFSLLSFHSGPKPQRRAGLYVGESKCRGSGGEKSNVLYFFCTSFSVPFSSPEPLAPCCTHQVPQNCMMIRQMNEFGGCIWGKTSVFLFLSRNHQ